MYVRFWLLSAEVLQLIKIILLYHKASEIQLCKILSISTEVLKMMKYGTCIIQLCDI